MHHHSAFGLKIDAPFALPELASRPAGSPSDVAIRFGELGLPELVRVVESDLAAVI